MKQKKEREKEISQWPWIFMLPFGILAGYWGDKEVRITAISEYGFQTRLAVPATAEQKNAPWELAFYDQKTASYQRILLRDATLLQEKEEDFDTIYTFVTDQEDYRNAVQRLALQYSQYIRWKMEDDDAALAEEMTGYPAEQDAFHLESLEEQKKVWFSGIGKETFVALQNGFAESGQPGQPVELALELDRPEWYTAYFSMESAVFFDAYFRKNQIPDPSIFHPDRLYIGNAFCPHLAPTEEKLFALMDKACRESFAVTLVFPFLLEENLSETQARLQHLARWCEQENKTIEIVVNDWGTAHLAAQFPVFSLCLGVLLNKRKKDPRMTYKLGDRTLFKQNSVHAAFYREYLKEEFRMERYEWESCGDTDTGKFPEGKNSLHLPFYQTNTSQYCPLYAACTKGSRGAQTPVRECSGFCEKQAFLYPEHLRMVGRYNSLFGVDLDVWKRMEEMLELRGVDRVVVNLL
ncbi:hypothetical protein LIZ62_10245 [Fusicatenibacter saccharivorans]|uniref:hypothetical protein n=1 Tax=Fusicatenibacter saccharivorans TaxID=1150298 RepID=UPI001D08107C|nr:hypothetical protein [Fusicatenibacter saccharivorans]MCB7100615.1 hypothetical protein [Fusicatenibacter saccharivorans]